MDAQVGDWVVINDGASRDPGFVVQRAAGMEQLAIAFGDKMGRKQYKTLAEQARKVSTNSSEMSGRLPLRRG